MFGVGCGEAGVGVAWTREARGVVGKVEEAGREEGSALLVAASPREKSPASLACFSSVISIPVPKKRR